MNTAIFLLRATQVGISIKDLEDLSIGLVFDMVTESGNDQQESEDIREHGAVYEATQKDFDRF